MISCRPVICFVRFAISSTLRSVEALRKAGVQVGEAPPQELARMREKAKPVIDKYSKEVGDALVKEVNAGIAQVRAGK